MRFAILPILILFGAAPVPGDKIDNFTLEDTSGKKHTLHEQKDTAIVLFFIGTECPMVNRYLHRMAALHSAWKDKGVTFFAINPNSAEKVEDIADHARKSAIPFPVLLDRDQAVADGAKVAITPTVLLLDKTFTVRYRGAIDDHKVADLVRTTYLADAITTLIDGKEIRVPVTEPAGCVIQRRREEAKNPEVTYSSHVAAILNTSCVSCHRPGQVAPFSLTTYEHAARWARDIKRSTQVRSMPPWKPANHGTFRDERWMSAEDVARLAAWADAGAPLGDAAKVPPAPKFAEGWSLGEPDLVLKSESYDVPVDGRDEYRCFVIPTDLPEDRWISAVEIRPGNTRIVHHVIAYVDTSKRSEALDAKDTNPGYRSNGTGPGFIPAGEMGGWAPGNMPYRLPDGIGRLLAKKAKIVLEVHYHKNGRAEKDQTTIGLHFSKNPIERRLRWIEMLNFEFRIPKDKEDHKVTARQVLGDDIKALSVTPHMHLLGRKIKVRAVLPDKTEKVLVDIVDWDFNWQDTYHFKEGIDLPKGTTLWLEAIYDNSAKNPNNPNNPPRDVTWGEQTTDEMCIAFIAYIRAGELKPGRTLGVTLDGMTVTELVEESPAAAAGMKVGDEIVKLGKRTVRTLEDLVEAIQKAEKKSQITIKRDDKTEVLDVEFTDK